VKRPGSIPRNSGFTLIELGIVLTVIALLLAMVVKGTGLIDSAKSTAVIATIKDLSTASRQFKERYRYWPGDLPNAGIAIPNLPAACDMPTSTAAIGDGQINTAAEVSCAIEELSQAGLIKADIIPATGMHGVTHETGVFRLIAGSVSNVPNFLPGTNVVEVSNLSCAAALVIDQKIDDGNIALASAGRAKASVASCSSGGANDPVPFYAAAMN
jgi:prepilin-type N-terminal cleavage/methylation domain-containing protein